MHKIKLFEGTCYETVYVAENHACQQLQFLEFIKVVINFKAISQKVKKKKKTISLAKNG